MATITPSENLQVIRCWLMAAKDWPSALDSEQLLQLLHREAAIIDALTAAELVEKAKTERDENRRERLLTWSWRHDYIPLSDFGPWRTVGDGLPLEACRRSAVDAANFIRQYPDNHPGSLSREQQVKYQAHVRRIRTQAQFIDILRSFPLLSILVVEQNQRGREDCERLKFASEDGSHRAIAMAFAGHDMISSWIGNPRPERPRNADCQDSR